ncbi:COG2426 family protein [Butyrivibrio sp. AE3004]|uniref:COG2426 family protein n=1 Tax=Butyrivibrio sp. AE3004 TaxID=1506994 RepID=UPI00056CBBB7|nr:small multi-drug export protein [Butyrivibrio sp. AE3004]
MLSFFRNSLIGQYIFVFFLSMVPLVELRGAVPFAYGFLNTSTGFNIVLGYILIAIGNMIPMPFIFFFARRLLVWGKDKPVIGRFFTFCLEKGEKGGMKLQEKAGRGLYLALLLFVGIPVPGTGAWTGTLAASILDMDFKKSVLAVIGGIALAGTIMGIVSFVTASAIVGIAG